MPNAASAPSLPPADRLPGAEPPGDRRVRAEITLPPDGPPAGDDAVALTAMLFLDALAMWADAPDFTVARIRAGSSGPPVVGALHASPGGTAARRLAAVRAQLDRDEPLGEDYLREETPVAVVDSVGRPAGARPYDARVALCLLIERGAGATSMAVEGDPLKVPATLPAAIAEIIGEALGREPSADLRQARVLHLPAHDQAVIRAANATDGDVPGGLLHELLMAQVEEHPRAEAVVDARRRLTYRELAERVWRIARRLRLSHDVRAGELVAVAMEKGWEQYVAVYGVLAAGGAYLPIDPALPAARQRLLLESSGVRTVLGQSWSGKEIALPAGVARVDVDIASDSGETAPLPSAQEQTDRAYVIFTSGSTGVPKGVEVDHRGVVNLVTDVNRRFAVTGRDRLLGVSALHFDASVYDVFGVLAGGGTVVLPEPFDRPEPDRWAELITRERVTLWNSVPALMEMLTGQAEIGATGLLSSLRLAVLSGDWIPLTLPGRLRAQAPAIEVVGSGGPAETICWSLFQPIGDVDPSWIAIPYGKPITNQRYHIIDPDGFERPVGAAGEMAVSSEVGLARGYAGDPERTARQFVDLPCSDRRAYLTGDLGRRLPDGTIEILGRDDFQVKIQGLRIELGEIEAALRAQDAVNDAVVVAPRAGTHGHRRLAAFVTGPEAEPQALRKALLEVLPRYMVPASITAVEAFPLTGNAKIDRRALIERADGHTAGRDAAPAAVAGPPVPTTRESLDDPGADALVKIIAAEFAAMLGIEDVAPGDNFFRLGGDSLGGTMTAKSLTSLLRVPVPVRELYERPSPIELARWLVNDSGHGQAATEAALALDLRVSELAAAEATADARQR